MLYKGPWSKKTNIIDFLNQQLGNYEIKDFLAFLWIIASLNYTYINSLNPRGQVSIFKTLEMSSVQIPVTDMTNALKIQKSKI